MKGASIKYMDNYTKCQVVVSVTKNGKRTRYKKTFKVDEKLKRAEREKQLEEKARIFRNKIKDNEYLKGEDITFKQFVDVFMREHAKKNLSPSTALRYKQLLDRAINSPLGNCLLVDIKPIDLIKFYDSLEEKQTRVSKSGEKEEYYLSKQTILHHQKVNGNLFTNWLGGESNTFIPSTLSAKFKEFLKRVNLPIVKLHSLRHANISIMIASGVDPKTASVRAGHSNVGITMNIYTHFQNSQDKIAAEKINEALA